MYFTLLVDFHPEINFSSSLFDSVSLSHSLSLSPAAAQISHVMASINTQSSSEVFRIYIGWESPLRAM
jgi:hypothetical protein